MICLLPLIESTIQQEKQELWLVKIKGGQKCVKESKGGEGSNNRNRGENRLGKARCVNGVELS